MSYKVAEPNEERKTLPSRGIKTTPPIWMQEKAKRDQELWQTQNNDLWIVENKLYDLSSFIDNHPGGQSWIRLTRGQDITEHFIVHHLNQDKARQVLNKFYVRDCKKKITRLSFEENGLYRTVKRKLLQKYSPEQLQNQKPSQVSALIILCLFFLLLSLTVIYKSYLAAFLCSLPMIGIVGVGHNFVHHRTSIFRKSLNLVGFTHTQFQIMHCISHHLYPNTQLDYEVAAFEPIGYYLRTSPENNLFNQILLEFLFACFSPINVILKLIVVPLTKFKKPDPYHTFPLLVFFFIYLNCNTFGEALKFFLIIYCSFSFLLMKALFCGHRIPTLWTEGAEKIEDFGQHTVLATSDSDTWIHGIFSYMFFAGFNIHVTHHFFPTADHHMLPKIKPILTQVCKEKGIKMTEQNRWECMKSINKGFLNREKFTRKSD